MIGHEFRKRLTKALHYCSLTVWNFWLCIKRMAHSSQRIPNNLRRRTGQRHNQVIEKNLLRIEVIFQLFDVHLIACSLMTSERA